MTQMTDEQLSAYLDNELPAEDMQRIRTLLQQSDELQQRLVRLQLADQAARQFFARLDNEPLPANLEQLITGHQPQDTSVVRLPARRAPRWGIAASVLLISGLYWHWHSPASQLSTAESQALLTLSSGSVQILDKQTRLELRWSELTPAGDFCRHYVVHTPQNSVPQTACWQDNRWQRQPGEDYRDQYQPASAGDGIPLQAMPRADEEHWLQQLQSSH